MSVSCLHSWVMNVTRSTSEVRQVEPVFYRFGPLMQMYRLAAGKTQTEIAAELGVAATRVNAIERGRAAGPGLELVAKLQPMLGLSPEQVDLMRDVAARDRVLLCAKRSGLDAARISFLSASLDAAVSLGSQELDSLRKGLEGQVEARQRTSRFLGRPTLCESAA